MAITNQQKTQILKIVAGLFNGGISAENLSAQATLVDNGTSMIDLSNRLAASPTFTENIMGGKFTVQGQVNVMMNNFGLIADSNPTSVGSIADQFFTDNISAGVGFGAIVNAAVNFLSQDNVPTAFAATAALLNNKALVAEIYAPKNPPNNFSTMIALLADVTATSPATREEAIAFVEAFEANKISLISEANFLAANIISLTSEDDNLVGTSGVDIFIGDEETTSVADTLVGGDGVDILGLLGTHIAPNHSGIEQILYVSPGGDISVANFAEVTSVELKNAAPGRQITTIQDQTVMLNNADMSGGEQSVVLAGDSVTSLDLILDKVGTVTNPGLIELTGTELTTLNIRGVNNESVVVIDSPLKPNFLNTKLNALNTLNIASDQNIKVFIEQRSVGAIDASHASGNIEIDHFSRNNGLVFKGGSGNDTIRTGVNQGERVIFDNLLMGGAGIDTLSVFNGNSINSASAVANISEFELFQATGGGTYDLSFLNANNAFTGLKVSNFGGGGTTIMNINAASTNNIIITDGGVTALHASDFIADGGINDTATIALDHLNSFVIFPELDVLNLVSISDGTPTKIVNGTEQNSLTLVATDLDKIVITGDEAQSLVIPDVTPVREIDASGLNAAVKINTTGSPISSILVKGTTNDDEFSLDNSATKKSLLFTGGGSDIVELDGGSSSVHTMIFTATELNAGDLKAGDTTTVKLLNSGPNALVTINLSAELEGLLKSNGVLLSETNDNINILGTSLSGITNIAASDITFSESTNFGVTTFSSTLRLQFDLNGDGNYSATDDAQISLIGIASSAKNSPNLVYEAANDQLIYVVV